MTAPTSSSLSHALNPPTIILQKTQNELPRLQLAPPEHQKHLRAQAQAQLARQQDQHSSISPTAQPAPSNERFTSISSPREISPAVGVETTQSSSGQKRKTVPPKATNSKKRKTDQPQAQDESREAPLHYGFGTHYPYTYAYPGAPPPPSLPAFQPPQASNSSIQETGFNEFQWRLLNLCGEFYEAATELIRSTPHTVLSQSFQLLGRGTGLDPISVLNDARRTCDVMLANPQALATAPPPPTALPLPILTSLANLNSRASVSSVPTSSVAPPAYYQPQAPQPINTVNEKTSHESKEKDKAPNNLQGMWKDHEVLRLKALAEKYRVRDVAPTADEEAEEVPQEEISNKEPRMMKAREMGDVDWDKVVTDFGDERSRHQVLIKATHLGLKASSSLPGKKPKKKASISPTEAPPPLTLASTSAKSVPVGYTSSHIGATQSASASPSVTASTPTGTTAQPNLPTSTTILDAHTITPTDMYKSTLAPPPLAPPMHQHSHANVHSQYAQTGWYPHPQNPYYPYHQPMYYSHPQGFGMQGYGMQPQQGYYAQPPYAPPTSAESPPTDKPASGKGKRRERKSNGSASNVSSVMPVPPPSLPPKQAATEALAKSTTAATTGTSQPPDIATSSGSTPHATPSVTPASTVAAPIATGSSGILRRGPNNSLFTYTPLPHGPGGAATDQGKEI